MDPVVVGVLLWMVAEWPMGVRRLEEQEPQLVVEARLEWPRGVRILEEQELRLVVEPQGSVSLEVWEESSLVIGW